MHFDVKYKKPEKTNTYVNYIRTSTVGLKFLTDDQYKYTVAISKKQGNAVKRNRIRRVIKEIMRCNQNKYLKGSYVIFVNKKCDQLTRELLLNDLEKIIKKISLSQNK